MITERFLKLFKDFLENYKYYGTPRFYHRTKEQNFTKMCDHLSELLTLVTENHEVFDDVNIIEHLNKTILTAANSNPYLLTCWARFYGEYHKENKNKDSLESVTIQVGVDGAHSEQMAQELQSALTQSRQENALLKKQIDSLKDDNAALVLQNKKLEERLFEKGIVDSVHQQLVIAQKDLLALTKVLDSLHEMTTIKPKTQTDTIETSKPAIENVPDMKVKNTVNTNDNSHNMIINLHKPKAPSRGIAKSLISKSASVKEDKKDSSVVKMPQKEKKEEPSDSACQLQAELLKRLNAIRKVTEDKENKEKNNADPVTSDSWDNLSASQ